VASLRTRVAEYRQTFKPFEPEWEGFVTIGNQQTPLGCPPKFTPTKDLPGHFLESDDDCESATKTKKRQIQSQGWDSVAATLSTWLPCSKQCSEHARPALGLTRARGCVSAAVSAVCRLCSLRVPRCAVSCVSPAAVLAVSRVCCPDWRSSRRSGRAWAEDETVSGLQIINRGIPGDSPLHMLSRSRSRTSSSCTARRW